MQQLSGAVFPLPPWESAANKLTVPRHFHSQCCAFPPPPAQSVSLFSSLFLSGWLAGLSSVLYSMDVSVVPCRLLLRNRIIRWNGMRRCLDGAWSDYCADSRPGSGCERHSVEKQQCVKPIWARTCGSRASDEVARRRNTTGWRSLLIP